MPFGINFQFAEVSWIQFAVTLIAGMAVIIGGSLYFGMLKIFGKELKPYMTARLKKQSIFQIYSINNNVSLEFAKQERGGGFKLLDKKGKETSDNIIIPRSTYSVEGTQTALAYDLFPPLHSDFIEGLNKLKELGYKTISELEKDIKGGKRKSEDEFFKNYTNDSFIKLFHSTRQKYSLSITLDDVLKFLDRHSSQNFSESLATRDTNAMKKKVRENPAKKYAFIVCGLWVLGLLFILGYKVIYG